MDRTCDACGGYTCEACGKQFREPPGNKERAEAEAFENFGVPHASADPDMAIVCDDCYPLIMQFAKETGLD